MRNIKKVICTLLIAIIIIMAVISCGKSTGGTAPSSGKEPPFNSFRDIPGVTAEEITAVEALQKKYDSFVYGMTLSTESFPKENGGTGGYAVLFCEWLSRLFDIQFDLKLYSWADLYNKLHNGEIDFSGHMMPDEESLKAYYMTDYIASRQFITIRLSGSRGLNEIQAERPLRYAFTKNSPTEPAVAAVTRPGAYEAIWLNDYADAYALLVNGDIDAFVTTSAAEVHFINYNNLQIDDFFPLVFNPVSLATAKPELESIISVVKKALKGGARPYLKFLYSEGYDEYRRQNFIRNLNEDEKAYLQKTTSIPLAVQYFNYPMVFYNSHEKKWDGITFDILHEIKKITGLDFEIVNDEYTEMHKLMEMLRNGKAHMFSNIIFSPERESQFIWGEYKLLTDQYALLSKNYTPNVHRNDLPFARIALIKDTAYAEMFRAWFPNAVNTTEFENIADAFLALEQDKVDLLMSAKNNLLYYSHYYEFSGYNVNYLFNYFYDSAFAFNNEQTVLRSLMDKALSVIDTDVIVEQWITKTFDYRTRMAEARLPWFRGAISLVLVVLVLIIILFIRNRNEGKRLEKLVVQRTNEIRETDEYTLLLLDATPMSCTLWDRNLKIVNCNLETLRQFAAPDKEWLIENFLKLAPEFQPGGKKSVQDGYEKLTRAFDDGYVRFEWVHHTYSGEPLPCEVTLVRVKCRDDYLVAGYTRDLRKQKAYLAEIKKTQENLCLARDAAEASNQAKTIFLANMSHEIRTPMNSIIGFSELARDGNISPKTGEYLDNISENAKWLLQIINDILDISKIESGKMELELIPFSLDEIISSCQTLIMPRAKDKNLSLCFYAEPSIKKTLIGDPIRLRQAIINLLSNAVKFTHSGMVKFLTSSVTSKENRTTILFEVKDSGIGMNQEQIDRIFYPFMQADSSITRKYGGTGLGLPITRNIVEMMGGRLEVESLPGVGSKFSFELTFDFIDEIAEMPTHGIVLDELAKPNFEGEVLICEDNKMNQHVICEHLSRVGLKSVVANNGKEGVDVVKKRIQDNEKPFGLIFMDIYMPVMDGLEAASIISTLGINTPIVAMTANIMSDDMELYKASGIHDCVSKPFTSQELWKCLLEYFKPVSVSVIDSRDQAGEDEKLLNQLKVNFVKSNQTVFNEIRKAADNGDIKLAHRLAHTLKSNAGQIGEKQLQKAAWATEAMFSGGEDPYNEDKMITLEAELKSVLDTLAPLLQETAPKNKTVITDAGRVQEIFTKLEPMLMTGNPESLKLLDDIRAIPGAEKLVFQIEEFYFRQALEELSKLKKTG